MLFKFEEKFDKFANYFELKWKQREGDEISKNGNCSSKMLKKRIKERLPEKIFLRPHVNGVTKLLKEKNVRENKMREKWNAKKSHSVPFGRKSSDIMLNYHRNRRIYFVFKMFQIFLNLRRLAKKQSFNFQFEINRHHSLQWKKCIIWKKVHTCFEENHSSNFIFFRKLIKMMLTFSWLPNDDSFFLYQIISLSPPFSFLYFLLGSNFFSGNFISSHFHYHIHAAPIFISNSQKKFCRQ